jgi:hypothetical protein
VPSERPAQAMGMAMPDVYSSIALAEQVMALMEQRPDFASWLAESDRDREAVRLTKEELPAQAVEGSMP